MKKGRSKDHIWRLIKYNGDGAIYAHCSCGYEYNCSRVKLDGGLGVEFMPSWLHPYCPWCGARKKRYTVDIERRDRHPVLL